MTALWGAARWLTVVALVIGVVLWHDHETRSVPARDIAPEVCERGGGVASAKHKPDDGEDLIAVTCRDRTVKFIRP